MQTVEQMKKEGLQYAGFWVGDMHILPKRIKGPDGKWTWKDPAWVKKLAKQAKELGTL
jgi:hypothetical protein